MQKFFKITTEYDINDAVVHETMEETNINKVIDKILQGFRKKEVHLGIWMNPDMSIGEIIVLNDNFEQREYIKIEQYEKEN